MMPLDRNESYWMLDDEFVATTNAVGAREHSTYPDYRELKSALAKYAGVTPEQILVTAGSVAAIEYIARAYTENGGETLMPVPTFYYYEVILENAKAKVIPIGYEEKDGRFIFPLEKTLELLKNNSAKVLFLCHPNNPLGCPLSPNDISTLVEAARESDTLIVSDEAYFEFSSGSTFLPYLSVLPNLVIIRSLSKAFALSSSRVGYVIAAPDIISKLEKIMLPWTISYASVVAALALLARSERVGERRQIVIGAREHFTELLRAIPRVMVYPSETNFVLIRVPNADRVQDVLLKQGIRVALGEHMSRYPEGKKYLNDTLRVVVPAPEHESSFIEALQKALR